MKYYFFRDLNNEDNLLDDKTFHAAGYVNKLYCDLKETNPSGKDASVSYFDPFQGQIISTWRALSEIELFEVEQWEYENLIKTYDSIE